MNLSLNPENIISKFHARKGRKLVTDYRDKRALSYFEVFDFLGVEWLLIAKKDENSVLTEYYLQNKDTFVPEIFQDSFFATDKNELNINVNRSNKVDMDEFIRVDDGEFICTYGIATCTGFIVSYQNRFTYMAHLSPYDKIYNSDTYYTDLVTQIVNRLPLYEIYANEKPLLKFYIIATQNKTVLPIVDKLIEKGYLLSQIYFVANTDAARGNIFFDSRQESLIAEWVIDDPQPNTTVYQLVDERNNLGKKLKELVNRSE